MSSKAKYSCVRKCVKCHHIMSDRLLRSDLFDSNGVCPYCGNNNIGTVVDCYKVVGRFVRTSPWWNILAPKYIFIERNAHECLDRKQR
jgi:hypothetical protein